MLVHLVQDIVDRYCADVLSLQERDAFLQEILLRIDENFVIVPMDHSLATHLVLDLEQSQIAAKWS
jgi:hypothetical protein